MIRGGVESWLEAIADTPDRDNTLAKCPKFLPQAGDMDVNDAVNPVEVVCPERAEQERATERTPWVAGK